MNNALRCKIAKRKVNGDEVFEGTLETTGATPFKLLKGRGTNTTTYYTSRASLIQAAKAWATRHNYDEVDFGGTDTSSTTTKSKSNSNSKKLATLTLD